MTTSIVSLNSTTSKLQVNNQDSFSFDSSGNLNYTSVNSGYLYGNRVINGAQEIDQVNSGAAVTPTANAYLTDMFGAQFSVASKLTFQQVADAPAGLKNSMKITVAAQYSPAVAEVFSFLTAIEGKDVIDFQLGTAGAATITFSKWIKGSVAGTYSVSLHNSAGNRCYVGTITVTTSWTQVKLTLTGDVSGTWLTDNGIGLLLRIDLGSGTNYNATAGVWGAGDLRRTSGSVTFVNQVAGSTLNITGVDCRLGSVAPTVFERRANELQLAQRYYEIALMHFYGTQTAGGAVGAIGTNKVTKRATPTVGAATLVGGLTNFSPIATIVDGNGNAITYGSAISTGTCEFSYSAPLSARLF